MYDGETLLELSKQKVKEKEAKQLARDEAHQQREEAKQQKKRLRDEAALNHVCRGDHATSVAPIWRDSPTWLWCEYCEEFGLCTRCSKKYRWMLTDHEDMCMQITDVPTDEEEDSNDDEPES